MTSSKVGLNQNPQGESGIGSGHESGRSPRSALEFIAYHSRSSPHVALLDGSRSGAVQGLENVFTFDVESVDIVEITVPGFADYGERPGLRLGESHLLPGDHGFMHSPDAVRIGYKDGAMQKPRFLQPGHARHFAIAIEGKPSGVNRVVVRFAAGKDGGYTGPDGALPHYPLTFPFYDGNVTHLDTGNIGYGIEGARIAIKGNSQVAPPRFLLGQEALQREGQRQNQG